MAIVVTCPLCESSWDVSRDALFRGQWQRCPFCGGLTGGDAVEEEDEEASAA